MDRAQLERIRNGEEEAFVRLYESAKTSVFGFALHMCGRRDLAEEVTQETFALFLEQLKRFDPDRSDVLAYLIGIARNRLRRHMRRQSRYVAFESQTNAETSLAEAPGRSPQEKLLQGERLRLVRKAILALPEKYREVIVLCDLEEISYQQAAEALGCRVGTLRSRLHRARELLGRKLTACQGRVVGLDTAGELL